MAKSLYELEYDFESLDLLKSEQVKGVVTKFFPKGRSVFGEPYKKENIIVDSRYVIPLDCVKKTDKLSGLAVDDVFTSTINRISKETKEQKENFNGVPEVPLMAKVKKESNAFKNGAILGLGVGVVSALYFKKSVFWFGFLGLAFGGYVASTIYKETSGTPSLLNKK